MITQETLQNGNVIIRYNRLTIFCSSPEILEALRLHLAEPTIESLDDTRDALEERVAAFGEHPPIVAPDVCEWVSLGHTA